ncbi:LysE family translocator [Gemmobacter denitrificans]|uniref:LysE family translocator n=1 Tax=Gemmobacter denitrificans TaxID=3123040 RepID=A0ABU8BV71_9RHOB
MTCLDLCHDKEECAAMLDLLLSFPPGHLAAFLAAGIALNLTPGADVIFATASGMAGGPKAGAVAGLGVGLGGLWHVGLAAAGVSALLVAHPGALIALKWAGAAYLAYLAWKSWRAVDPTDQARGVASPGRALWRGFLTNALNPKVALFVLAFLPQFTLPGLGPVWQQIVVLGLLFSLTGTIITAGYGALAGIARQSLGRRLGFLNKIAALLFGGLAAKLVLE